eukprot:scaffold2191_cov254-Pinguiococcus_pyrenoidosus.AAC.23
MAYSRVLRRRARLSVSPSADSLRNATVTGNSDRQHGLSAVKMPAIQVTPTDTGDTVPMLLRTRPSICTSGDKVERTSNSVAEFSAIQTQSQRVSGQI